MEVTTTATVTSRQIADQVVTAVEGGSNFWMKGFCLLSATHLVTTRPWYDDEHLYDGDFSITVTIDDEDTPSKVITQADFKTGLTKMAEKYPKHFKDLVNDEGDANTADLLMQCVLFGEETYG